MFENKRPALVLVTLYAGSVVPADHFIFGQHDVLTVRAVTGVAGNPLFLQRVMILEVEKRLHFRMTLVAGLRIFPGVDDVLAPSSSSGHMQAAGTVTCFAAEYLLAVGQRDGKFGMPGVFEIFYRLRVAQGTAVHADVFGTRYRGRRSNRCLFHGGTG